MFRTVVAALWATYALYQLSLVYRRRTLLANALGALLSATTAYLILT